MLALGQSSGARRVSETRLKVSVHRTADCIACTPEACRSGEASSEPFWPQEGSAPFTKARAQGSTFTWSRDCARADDAGKPDYARVTLVPRARRLRSARTRARDACGPGPLSQHAGHILCRVAGLVARCVFRAGVVRRFGPT